MKVHADPEQEKYLVDSNASYQPMPGGNGHLPGQLQLNQITMVGSHNAGSSKAYNWFYAQQRVTITDQFVKYGARFFKIPLHWFYPKNRFCGCFCCSCCSKVQPYPAIAHEPDGKLNCRLTIFQRCFRAPQKAEDLFTELRKIADQYPREAIIIKIEDYIFFNTSNENGTSKYSMQQIADELDQVMISSGLKEKCFRLSSIKKTPTLDELRKGKNVILLIDIRDPLILCDNINQFLTPAYMYLAQSNWNTDPLNNVDFSLTLGRGTYNEEGDIDQPLFEIHLNPPASFSWQFYSEEYNKKQNVLLRYKAFCDFYKLKPTILAGDYINLGGIYQAVDEINNQLIETLFENDNQSQIGQIIEEK